MDTNIIALLLEEEEEEVEMILSSIVRKDVHELFKKRKEEGAFTILIKRYLKDDEMKFRKYFRVSREMFFYILSFIKEDITKKSYNRVLRPISAEEKLCITLRFMATGETYRSLEFQFRVSHCWISSVVKETLRAICRRMMRVAIPQITQTFLLEVSDVYDKTWNFPNCCGAVDGKHIRVKCPKNSGSLFYNYKEYFSVVLLALVDANYKFLAIDIGSYGNEGDAGIFAKSNIGKGFSNGSFPLPSPKALPGCIHTVPHVVLGDEAFQLSPYMMRPFPRVQAHHNEEKAVFNLRLSRARRTSENAFGILCQYFRVFFTPIAINTEVIDSLVAAACIIHNLLRDGHVPYPKEDISTNEHSLELPQKNLIPLKKQALNASSDAYAIREQFKNYFSSPEGMLNWQLNRVRRTQ